MPVFVHVQLVTRDGKKHLLGVIEIPSFYFDYRSRRAGQQYRSVSEDTANAFEALKAKKVEGIIIDLRNDPGGSLEEVARMLGQVIKSGQLCKFVMVMAT